MALRYIKKGTKKLIRALALTIFILVIFVIFGLPVVVEHFIGTQAIIGWVSSELSIRLNRQILIDHAVVGLWQGFDLRGFKLSESPNFRSGTFIDSQRFILKPNLAALLLGDIVIGELTASGLKVNMSRNPTGEWNFEDLVLSRRDSPRPMRLASGPPIRLKIKNVQLSQGYIIIEDSIERLPRVTLRDIDFNIRNWSFEGRFPFNFSFSAKRGLA